MKKRLVLALLLVGLLAFGAGIGTYAWFTSTATSTNNEFVTGTLKLDINGEGDEEFNLDLGPIGNLAPGEKTDEVSIEIKNDGSLDLVWFGKFVINDEEGLSNAIYIDDMKMEFLDDEGEINNWEVTDHFIKDGKGYGEYGDHYDGLIDEAMGVITLANFLNDNAMGAGNGVQMGALKPGYSYRLTFTLGMAEAAGNEYQGKSMDLAYTIDATQVNEGAISSLLESEEHLSGDVSHLYNWFVDQIEKQE